MTDGPSVTVIRTVLLSGGQNIPGRNGLETIHLLPRPLWGAQPEQLARLRKASKTTTDDLLAVSWSGNLPQ